MRIVAGRYGGRRLTAPPRGDATRPTSDRVREALFQRLGPLDGAAVLDLFAGSGALALEALSRGAAHATLGRLRACRDQGDPGQRRGARARRRARPRSAARTCALSCAAHVRARHEYDLVLLDPPYRLAAELGRELSPLLRAVRRLRRARRERERPARSARTPDLPLTDERRYGDTLIRTHEHDLSNRIAVCPGSYDPVTNGHLDVIGRAASIFDEVVVAVVNLPIRKGSTLFTTEERISFVERATAHLGNVRVAAVQQPRRRVRADRGAKAIVKGLRAISDFEYELEMHQLNRREAPEIESVYLMASSAVQFLAFQRRQGACDVWREHRRSRPRLRGSTLEGRARPLTKQRFRWTSWF